MSPRTDILVVSLGTTLGWRLIDRGFVAQLERAGVEARAVSMGFGAASLLRRGYPVNDLVEMHAARRATLGAIPRTRPRAVVFSTTTSVMLAPRLDVPYAVRLDAPARMNRPGIRNSPLWWLERRALGLARLVLPMSEVAREALPPGTARSVVVPPPVDPSGPRRGERERLAIAYVPDPKAKGLDVLAAAWAEARVEGARLEVYGLDPGWARAHLRKARVPEPATMELRGTVPPSEFRARVRRAHAYVGAARWEDFGQAPLEALADGTLLATVPSGGPFEALRLARELDPALVASAVEPLDLARAIGAAFGMPQDRAAAYADRASALVRPLGRAAVQATLEREVLPVLLGRP